MDFDEAKIVQPVILGYFLLSWSWSEAISSVSVSILHLEFQTPTRHADVHIRKIFPVIADNKLPNTESRYAFHSPPSVRQLATPTIR